MDKRYNLEMVRILGFEKDGRDTQLIDLRYWYTLQQ